MRWSPSGVSEFGRIEIWRLEERDRQCTNGWGQRTTGRLLDTSRSLQTGRERERAQRRERRNSSSDGRHTQKASQKKVNEKKEPIQTMWSLTQGWQVSHRGDSESCTQWRYHRGHPHIRRASIHAICHRVSEDTRLRGSHVTSNRGVALLAGVVPRYSLETSCRRTFVGVSLSP